LNNGLSCLRMERLWRCDAYPNSQIHPYKAARAEFTLRAFVRRPEEAEKIGFQSVVVEAINPGPNAAGTPSCCTATEEKARIPTGTTLDLHIHGWAEEVSVWAMNEIDVFSSHAA